MTNSGQYNSTQPCRIGVLVPYTNTNLEPDLQWMRPFGASIHVTRIGGYAEHDVPGADEMAAMGESGLETALQLIAGCRPHAVIYGCTSATLALGRKFDLALADRIRLATGAVTATAAGAIVTALAALDVTRISLASPYTSDINTRTIRFLAEAGIETLGCVDIGTDLLSHQQGEVTPDQIVELARQANHREAQAIVLPCTDLRATKAITRIETTLGKPVVTSNQALMFAISRSLRLSVNSAAPGRLFQSGEITAGR